MKQANRRFTPGTVIVFLSLLAALVFGQAAAAYADNGAAGPDIGYYRTESLMGISAETLATVLESGSVDEVKNMFTMDLKEDGTCIFNADGDTATLYWKAEGGKILLAEKPDISAADEKLEGTIADGIITLDVEGTELRLKKEETTHTGGAETGKTAGGTAAEKTETETGKENTAVSSVPEDISGVYRLNTILGMDMATYAAITGKTLEEATNTWVMDMKKDGTAYMAVDGNIARVAWERNGDKITLIAMENGVEERLEGTLSEDRILLNIDGTEVALKHDPVAAQ